MRDRFEAARIFAQSLESVNSANQKSVVGVLKNGTT
jgi:hypothetical protein